MDQLKKALKICDVCMTSAKNLYLCVELLNKYLYYYVYEAPFMTADDVNNMIDFIKEQTDGLEDRDAAKDGLLYFENTKKAIKFKQLTNERLKAIKSDWSKLYLWTRFTIILNLYIWAELKAF